MTVEELQFIVESKREFDFLFEEKRFLITYGKNEAGDWIQLAREFESGQKFSSFKQMMAEAKIGNHYFREYIKSL